jgi:hypothetical protein
VCIFFFRLAVCILVMQRSGVCLNQLSNKGLFIKKYPFIQTIKCIRRSRCKARGILLVSTKLSTLISNWRKYFILHDVSVKNKREHLVIAYCGESRVHAYFALLPLPARVYWAGPFYRFFVWLAGACLAYFDSCFKFEKSFKTKNVQI